VDEVMNCFIATAKKDRRTVCPRALTPTRRESKKEERAKRRERRERERTTRRETSLFSLSTSAGSSLSDQIRGKFLTKV